MMSNCASTCRVGCGRIIGSRHRSRPGAPLRKRRCTRGGSRHARTARISDSAEIRGSRRQQCSSSSVWCWRRDLCAITESRDSSQATFAQTSAVATRRSNGPAIAVLPLRNLSAEPGTEEFVDGFTEEIINDLQPASICRYARERRLLRSRTRRTILLMSPDSSM